MLDGTFVPLESGEPNVVGQTPSSVQVAYLAVKGMQGEGCGRRIRNALFALDGVLTVDVLVPYHEVSVAYDTQQVSPANVVQAVAEIGVMGEHPYSALLLKVAPAEEVLVV